MVVLPPLLLALGLAGAPDAVYLADLEASRMQRAANLTREDGWTALVGLHWLDAEASTSIGSDPGNDLVVAHAPAVLGRFHLQNGRWLFTPAEGADVVARGDGTALAGPVAMTTDREAAAAGGSATRLQAGSLHWTLIQRGLGTGLRIWDSEAPGRVGFKGLNWFAPDPGWRIEAAWVPHDPPRTIEIATVLNTLEPMRNPGALHFERDGRKYVLEALADEGDAQLFLIFADRSNRADTYGAGRYLYADVPALNGTVLLDFNRAVNPPCAYTPFATCPLPPPENRLDLSIEAGEKRY